MNAQHTYVYNGFHSKVANAKRGKMILCEHKSQSKIPIDTRTHCGHVAMSLLNERKSRRERNSSSFGLCFPDSRLSTVKLLKYIICNNGHLMEPRLYELLNHFISYQSTSQNPIEMEKYGSSGVRVRRLTNTSGWCDIAIRTSGHARADKIYVLPRKAV